MSKFIKYDSTLTGVTATAEFDNTVLYGKPEFTGGNTYTTVTCGFSGVRIFEGYNFDSVQGVLLSTFANEDLAGLNAVGTYALTGVSALSYLSGGATIDPPLSGVFLTVGTSAATYTLNSYNSMSVTFPTISAPGIIDIIPINAAGFALNAAYTGPINIKTRSGRGDEYATEGYQYSSSHQNQIYVSYE